MRRLNGCIYGLVIVGSVVGMGVFGAAPADTAPRVQPESTEHRDARVKWWREARFGMFIHWGVYSVPAGTWQDKQIPSLGEWIMLNGKIPVADYAAFAKRFNPVKFDANQWVDIAKNAGVKYMVITSKHHDGFAMFHTAVDDYNIVDATPFKRDPLKELSEAAASHDMKLGFYYSQAQDWHHPGGAALRGGHWDKAQDGDYDAYLKKVAEPQVREILTNYGKVAELWFDTPVDMTTERATPFLELLKLQPDMVVNDRLMTGHKVGDFSTPEQYIPATGLPGKDWETCMTMNDTWGYKSYDDHWKPASELIHNLINAASKGGNYLLNVGPTSEGEIPPESVERLAAIGKWMKTNGEAIYSTTASPFRLQHWGRCTKKIEDGKTTLYLEVFDWPKNGVLNLPVKNAVTKAYLLADASRTFAVKPDEDGGQGVALTGDAPDAVASVVVIEMNGLPEVVDQAVRVDAKGNAHLDPMDATVKGVAFSEITDFGNTPARLTRWSAKGTATWQAKLAAGTYKVSLRVSKLGDHKLSLKVGEKTYALGAPTTLPASTDASTPATAAASAAFVVVPGGTIEVEKDGVVNLELQSMDAARDLAVAELVLEPG